MLHDFTVGQNGFEELRRYVKQGSDFGKDLVAVLQERVESEHLYAKSLSKTASKLNKACREVPGTLADAWRNIAAEMESRSEVHRQFSATMTKEIVKPLKQLLENQNKARKLIECNVDKSTRILSEWRNSETKAKKTSHTAARENEKLQDAMLDVRIQQRANSITAHTLTLSANAKDNTISSSGTTKDSSTASTPMSLQKIANADKETKNVEKDAVKLDGKRRKAEESMNRADTEYYTFCTRAERARINWEIAVIRGAAILKSHEHQRLQHLKQCLSVYMELTNDVNPNLATIIDRLQPHIGACDVQKDLSVFANIHRCAECPSEQLLPDFYCEHTTLAMNRERRVQALNKLLHVVRTDLDRERETRVGLEESSHTADLHKNQTLADKLHYNQSMITYLEGAHFKLQSVLLELDHKPRVNHPLAAHIQITRDRSGVQQSILKVPAWMKNDLGNHVADAEFRESTLERVTSTSTSTSTESDDTDYAINRLRRSRNNGQRRSDDLRSEYSAAYDRSSADGGSNQHDSEFDEFSSQDEDDKDSIQMPNQRDANGIPKIISRCKAIYSYTPKLADELRINPGDIIDVHKKQEDGWWIGAIKERVGIFPATYVEEFV